VATLVAGRFSRNVSLSGGDNVIVVRAEDAAGNFAERRFGVTFASSSASPVGAVAGIVFGSAVIFVLVLLLARRFLFPRRSGSPPDGDDGATETLAVATPAVKGGTAPAEPLETSASEEDEFSPSENTAETPPEDPRIVKLRKAYESGRISGEVYAQNLKRLAGKP